MNLRELRELFRLVEKTDFTEVEVIRGDWKVRIERKPASHVSSPLVVSHVPAPHFPIVPTVVEKTLEKSAKVTEILSEQEQMITSPFVGTFYASPAPDSEAFVKVGQTVKKGQTLCIIEAMKLMNEIESDFDGKILEIYPKNGKPVEFGEKLFRIQINP